MKDLRRYRRFIEYGIEIKINGIFHKYGIKREAYYGAQLNDVCVRHLIADYEDIIDGF